jgi:hypothetical protein
VRRAWRGHFRPGPDLTTEGRRGPRRRPFPIPNSPSIGKARAGARAWPIPPIPPRSHHEEDRLLPPAAQACVSPGRGTSSQRRSWPRTCAKLPARVRGRSRRPGARAWPIPPTPPIPPPPRRIPPPSRHPRTLGPRRRTSRQASGVDVMRHDRAPAPHASWSAEPAHTILTGGAAAARRRGRRGSDPRGALTGAFGCARQTALPR